MRKYIGQGSVQGISGGCIKQLWGGELWNDGYFVRRLVGDKVTSKAIRRYIKYQHQEQLVFDF